MKLTSKIRPLAAAGGLVLGTAAVAAAVGGGSSDSAVAPARAESVSPAAAPAPKFSHPRTIDNRYLPITARRRCAQRGEEHDGTKTRSVQTVLKRTRRFQVNGQAVDAVVLKDKAYNDGKLIEIALDYFAQADDGTVYYLGERVDNIKKGKVTDHHGTWLLGKDTDVPGVAMPADPKLGDQFHLEDVPGITAESNRVEEVGMRAKAGGRLYTGVIRVQEFIQPEGEIEYKLYAPGVGIVTEYEPEGRAELTGCR